MVHVEGLDYSSIRPTAGDLNGGDLATVMEAETDFERESARQLPPQKAYRLNACRKEPWTVAFIEAMPANSRFWDIGANVGSYALVAAARAELWGED